MWIRFRPNLQISWRVLLLCFVAVLVHVFPTGQWASQSAKRYLLYLYVAQTCFHSRLHWGRFPPWFRLVPKPHAEFFKSHGWEDLHCFKTWNWYGSLAHLHVHPVGTAIRSSTACHMLHFSPQAQDFVDVVNCLFDLWDTNGWAQWYYISISRNSVCIMICSVCSFADFRACLHIILTIPKIKQHGWAARQGYWVWYPTHLSQEFGNVSRLLSPIAGWVQDLMTWSWPTLRF